MVPSISSSLVHELLQLYISFWWAWSWVNYHLHIAQNTYLFLSIQSSYFLLQNLIVNFNSIYYTPVFLYFFHLILRILKTLYLMLTSTTFSLLPYSVHICHILRCVYPCWRVQVRGVESGVLKLCLYDRWDIPSSTFSDGGKVMTNFKMIIRNGDELRS